MLSTAGRFPAAILSVPASVVYGAVANGVRRSRRARRGTGWPGVRVISIGNLEVGGSGKTPLAMHLMTELERRGTRPVYVSRGFGSEAGRLPVVTVCVPAHWTGAPPATPGLRVLGPVSAEYAGSDERPVQLLASQIGDEGMMVVTRCPRVPLAFSRDRRKAVDAAVQVFQPTHVIVDDAFQTWGLHRDLDVVLLDSRSPFGTGRLLPAGTLREPPSSLARADVIGINNDGEKVDLAGIQERVSSVCGRTLPVFGIGRRASIVRPEGAGGGAPVGPVAALSSIARPEAFDSTLATCDLDVALSIRYPDHHPYSAHDVEAIAGLIARHQIEHVVTTEKDWAKLRQYEAPFALWIARLDLHLRGADVLAHMTKPRA